MKYLILLLGYVYFIVLGSLRVSNSSNKIYCNCSNNFKGNPHIHCYLKLKKHSLLSQIKETQTVKSFFFEKALLISCSVTRIRSSVGYLQTVNERQY